MTLVLARRRQQLQLYQPVSSSELKTVSKRHNYIITYNGRVNPQKEKTDIQLETRNSFLNLLGSPQSFTLFKNPPRYKTYTSPELHIVYNRQPETVYGNHIHSSTISKLWSPRAQISLQSKQRMLPLRRKTVIKQNLVKMKMQGSIPTSTSYNIAAMPRGVSLANLTQGPLYFTNKISNTQ